MNMIHMGKLFVALGVAVGLAASSAAQRYEVSIRPLPSHVIMPQSRVFAMDRRATAEITDVTVGVVILEQTATTTMDIALRNPGGHGIDAELLMPVPDGAVVRGFTFQGAAKEPTAEILRKDDARRTYDSIVAKVKDPALLEFAGYNLIRSSVFPIEAGGTQKLRLTYEHLLVANGNRVDYVLPRSESLEYTVPWHVGVRITSKRPVATVYSPSHQIETKRADDKVITAQVASTASTQPGPFRLSYVIQENGVSASFFAYPDPKVGGGYFLLLAGVPPAPERKDGPGIKREITLVLDRSGSMNGEKIEQVREATLQVLAGLEEGEAFNIIAYHQAVESFAKEPVLKSAASEKAAREYVKAIKAGGGTNIHDALVEALRQKPMKDFLPIVLFLTDGLPTVGQTSEVAIREAAAKANTYNRRIFTFGVGVDVNTPLLEKIAVSSRAAPTFVMPKEDVEVKVAQVFKRLSGPVLASPELEAQDGAGTAAMGRVRDTIPAKLPDLFDGDQLILLGQYAGEEPLTFKLTGNYLGKERAFRFTLEPEKATTKNAFVPRLWASRKIAVLTDAIRQLGADAPLATSARPAADPRLKELVDEIVKLSTEFGILTEYTAFLAREGTNLAERDEVLRAATHNFEERAMRTRSGMGSLNQSYNNDTQFRQQALNVRNSYFDQNMNRVSIANVQQVSDRAFFQRGNRWVDSRIVNNEANVKPARVIEFGSAEFGRLAARLAEEGRQGTIALRGEILMVVDNETVLVRNTAE
jgi:Ca-activated chloride channel homolog